MRLDAHQHFWHYTPTEHFWMTEAMSILKRDYLPDDLKSLLSQAEIQGTMAVQARQNLQETEWLLDLANQHSFIRGVVGWVDLCAPSARAQLEHCSLHPALRGIRHIIHDEPDDRFMARPEFLRGLSLLAEFNLTYDLLLFPKHLPVALEVVRRLPRQPFVLDHLGKPLIKSQGVVPWEADVRALARCENVYCKVSGMVTEAVWHQWQITDFRQYLDIVFDAFGVDRLMFGSDWPVCTLSAEYHAVVDIVQDYISQFTPDVQGKIFGRNAAVFYGVVHS
jgi:L-fuconolactonase